MGIVPRNTMIVGTVYTFQHTGGEQVPVSMIQINEYILNSRGEGDFIATAVDSIGIM